MSGLRVYQHRSRSHLRSLQQMLDGYQANMKTDVDLTELAFAFAAIPADHERLIVQEVK